MIARYLPRSHSANIHSNGHTPLTDIQVRLDRFRTYLENNAVLNAPEIDEAVALAAAAMAAE
jgi:hypothetical protein